MLSIDQFDLTTEQRTFVECSESRVFVLACPGAGKTRAIAARHILRAQSTSARARAVLSFTNAAADEISVRCRRGGLLALSYPNFVGTFDAFINRFLVLPFRIKSLNCRPKIVESWDVLSIAIVRRKGERCAGFSLDALRSGEDGKPYLEFRAMPHPVRAVVAKDPERWLADAVALRKRLHCAGFMSCADARDIAKSRIRHTKGRHLAAALGARFEEIIVDEAQDCSTDEIELVRWLNEDAGVRVVLVADVDQSIYQWRDAAPVALAAHCQAIAPIRFTGNFRSSPAVCAFAATLRRTRESDHAVGPNKNVTIPVVVVLYPPDAIRSVGATFQALLAEHRLSPTSAIALSHQIEAAEAALGIQGVDQRGIGAGMVCWAQQYRRAAPGSDLGSLRRLSNSLGKCLRSKEKHGARPSLAEEWFEQATRQCAVGLLELVSRPAAEWTKGLRELIAGLAPPPAGREWRPKSIREPEDNWTSLEDDPVTVRVSTVHSFKGRQSAAVLLVVPERRERTEKVIGEWRDGVDSEAKRVLYVGATRAEQLLVVAIPQRFAAAVGEITAGLPIRVQGLTPPNPVAKGDASL